MPQLKVAVVGAGVIADAVHIPGILACPNLELAALCDTNPDRLKYMADKYGIAREDCYTGDAELFNRARFDAVDICTPNDAHVEIALRAVEHRKPYSVEKPLAMSTRQAEALADRTREEGLTSMVCFSYRFKAAARYARALVQSGELGEIYHVNMHYYQAWALPVYETPLYWRFEKARSGTGTLGDLGSHALDLVRFVTGTDYARVSSHMGTFIKERRMLSGEGIGKVDVDDYVNVLAEMEGGLPAVIQSTRLAFGRGNYQRMEIYGSRGALVYLLDVEPGLDQLYISTGEAMRRGNHFTQVSTPGEYQADQMQCFADLLMGKGDGLAATVEDGLKNQMVVDQIIASGERKEWMELKGR